MDLIENCVALLQHMYDPETALFSYSTTIQKDNYINDFENPAKYRYTINTILALQKLEHNHKSLWQTSELIDQYLKIHLQNDQNIGNRGLLLHILAIRGHTEARSIYEWIHKKLSAQSSLQPYPVQELAWVSFGVTTYAVKSEDRKALKFAEELIDVLHNKYMTSRTHLPRHNNSFRGRYVSFGGIVYFLMALHHYAETFNDQEFMQSFLTAVSNVIRLQGEMGEWPWFIDTKTGRIMDWYQVYSVHQDAMAMLFLLPAMDKGLTAAGPAITKSLGWLFGNNQLNKCMIPENPFLIYRSIRRNEHLERPKRILRSLVNLKPGHMLSPDQLSINRECRSYHIAWLIYAWIDRSDFPEFIAAAKHDKNQQVSHTIDG